MLFIYIILFLSWRFFIKGNKVVPQMFHFKFTLFVRVHGHFLMTTIKSTQSSVIPISYYVWVILCLYSWIWLHVCVSAQSAFRLHTSDFLGGCPAEKDTENGEILFFITDIVSTCFREPQWDLFRVERETDFLFFLCELLEVFISSLKKWPLTWEFTP